MGQLVFVRDGKAGRAVRGGPLVKNQRQTDLFNPLTHISPPRISPQPARFAGQQRDGAGWPANPQEKKKLALSSSKATQLGFHKILKKETQHNRVNNVYV